MKKKNFKSDLSRSHGYEHGCMCSKKPGAEDTAKDGDKKDSKGGYELALITDVGTIDDNLSTRIMGRSGKYAKSMISLTNITNRQKNLMRHV